MHSHTKKMLDNNDIKYGNCILNEFICSWNKNETKTVNKYCALLTSAFNGKNNEQINETKSEEQFH